MKKVILVALALLLAGCAGAFLPIPAPTWEKGQNYSWDVYAEGSGRFSLSEPGSPPVSEVIPPMTLVDGTVDMTILDVVNETFKWYPTLIEQSISFMPEVNPDATEEDFLVALRGSDLAQAQIFAQKDPFRVTPGIFQGGFEFPIDPDFRIEEDLEPSMPGLVVLVIEAGTTESITTPAGTFEASSIVWTLNVDEAAIEAMVMAEDDFTTFNLNVNIGGVFWFSPETEWLVKATAKGSGSFSATYDAPEGTYKASGSANANFDMSLTSHGIVPVGSLESYFANGAHEVHIPVIGSQQISDSEEGILTTIELSSDEFNAASETATVQLLGNGQPVEKVVFYLFDLAGQPVASSQVTDEWELPADSLGVFYVVADAIDSDYIDPADEIVAIYYDGEIENVCAAVTLPLSDDCTGSQFQVSFGIAELVATGQNTGLHTLSIEGAAQAAADTGILTSSVSIQDPEAGMYTITGEGDLGTPVSVSLYASIMPGFSNLNQGPFLQPVAFQPTPPRGTESSFAPLMQWLPESLQQSQVLPNIGSELGHLVFAGIPLENP